MKYPLRWASLGVVGFVVVLQAAPCTEEVVGCGASVGSDAVQSCDDYWVDVSLESDRSDVAVSMVEAASYVQELTSFGVSMPDAREAAAGSFAASSTAESIGRMEEYVLEHARESAADELVEVVLDLGDLPFPELPRLRAMDTISRHRVLSDRKALIEREQRNLVAYLEEVGAQTSRPVGLVNHLQARIPPDAMLGVVAHPDVEAVYPAWQPVILLYDHEELRQATFLSEYWDQEIKGETRGSACDPRVGYDDIKIAVIEGAIVSMVSNRINGTHPGWGDCEMDSCESRLRSEMSCSLTDRDADACLPWPEGAQDLGNHGTWVASIAAGDLTQGQDPAMTDPDERRKRTGIAPEASILYLNATSTGSVASAVAYAFVQGADVINLSLAITDCTYAQGADCGGLNDVFRMVTEGGALVVAAAGNENVASGRCNPDANCNVCYPAIRPEILSVANVDTPTGIDYDLAQISSDSSRGWARVGVGGQFAALYPTGVDIPAVSISAPGTICSYFSTADAYDDTGRSGTSFAAPVISAGAGLIREEFGNAVRDARMLKSHVLAMGDGSGGDVPKPGVTVGMSSTRGTGRVKFHPFGSMQSPKGMAHRSFEIQENELIVFNAADTEGAAFEAEVTQWKMGMHIDWWDLSAIPYLLITYWNACDRHELIASDLRPGLERHVILDGRAIDQACIEVRVFGYSVPAGGVKVFVTDYYHSGDPSAH
jgi:hypothetical protein